MSMPISDAKNRLGALIAEVERGHEITITRRGLPVAKLVRAGPTFDRDKARRAADGVRAASRGTTLGGVSLKDLVDEGRRSASCSTTP
jgi:prevent-host-death family protein